MKPLLNDGIRTNWHVNLMKKILVDKSFHRTENINEDISTSNVMIKYYKYEVEVLDNLEARFSLSVIQFDINFYVLYTENEVSSIL